MNWLNVVSSADFFVSPPSLVIKVDSSVEKVVSNFLVASIALLSRKAALEGTLDFTVVVLLFNVFSMEVSALKRSFISGADVGLVVLAGIWVMIC